MDGFPVARDVEDARSAPAPPRRVERKKFRRSSSFIFMSVVLKLEDAGFALTKFTKILLRCYFGWTQNCLPTPIDFQKRENLTGKKPLVN
jgi:hypothetical protein